MGSSNSSWYAFVFVLLLLGNDIILVQTGVIPRDSENEFSKTLKPDMPSSGVFLGDLYTDTLSSVTPDTPFSVIPNTINDDWLDVTGTIFVLLLSISICLVIIWGALLYYKKYLRNPESNEVVLLPLTGMEPSPTPTVSGSIADADCGEVSV